ncbi:MAG: hypothetical protein WBL85_02945 [Sedimentisphaerales bacterium]
MKPRDAIKYIIIVNEHIRDFWGNGGWAPSSAAEMLSKSRLDWQVSLSKNLLRWLPVPDEDEHDGSLILAWVNLGALVEGTMMWFLCVFHENYSSNPIKKKGKAVDPDELRFIALCRFFQDTVWIKREKRQWGIFVDLVRERRNAIHAYKNRSIGSFKEFAKAVIKYRSFLLAHEGNVPYPDEYAYPHDIYEMH